MAAKKKIIYSIFGLILLGGVAMGAYVYISSLNAVQQETTKGQDLSYFQNVREETFRNYQNTTTVLPKKGKFEFTIGLIATGNLIELNDDIQKSGINAFGSGFQSLILKLKGQYDFQDLDKATLMSTIKVYFNDTGANEGTGDLDLAFKISSDGKIVYVVNALDRFLLKNFGLSDEMTENLVAIYGENKGKQFTNAIPQVVMKQIIASLKNTSENSPLYQNTKDQEKAIIDSFLKNKVLDILTGTKSSDSADILVSEFNTDNFVNFMNDVSKIINTGDNVKNFSGDKEKFKQFTLGGKLWIKDKKILDSKFATEIPVKSTNKTTGNTDVRLLLLDSDFKMPNPEKFDIDFTNSLYRKDKTDNKLILTIKGLIN